MLRQLEVSLRMCHCRLYSGTDCYFVFFDEMGQMRSKNDTLLLVVFCRLLVEVAFSKLKMCMTRTRTIFT